MKSSREQEKENLSEFAYLETLETELLFWFDD